MKNGKIEKLGFIIFFTSLAMLCAMYLRGGIGFLQVFSMCIFLVAGVLLYVCFGEK